jgi:RHS repeat-associated protein
MTVRVVGGKLVDTFGTLVADASMPFGLSPVPATGVPVGSTTSVGSRSALGNPWLWQGQWFDYDAGLVYMRARHYDPQTGHFLQRDPMQYEDSVNLYAAMGNNPVSYRDPAGNNIVSSGRARSLEYKGPFNNSVQDLGRKTKVSEVAALLRDSVQKAIDRRQAQRSRGNDFAPAKMHPDAARLMDRAETLVKRTSDQFESADDNSVRVFLSAKMSKDENGISGSKGVQKSAAGVSYVAVDELLSSVDRIRVLVHEITHSNLERISGFDTKTGVSFLTHELLAWRRHIAFDLMQNAGNPEKLAEESRLFLRDGNDFLIRFFEASEAYSTKMGLSNGAKFTDRQKDDAMRLLRLFEDEE